MKAKKEKKTKRVVKSRVTKTRNGETWTESQFFSMIRSALRQKSRWWVPIKLAKEAARRPYIGPNKRMKWQFQCNHCKNWFSDKEVAVDHITECGSLTCLEDLPGFVERLFVEDINAFQILCENCHNVKTQSYKKSKK